MSGTYSPVDRERAEVFAQRAAIVAILRVLSGANQNAVLDLKRAISLGASILPGVAPAIGSPLPVRDELVQAHLKAIFDEAG